MPVKTSPVSSTRSIATVMRYARRLQRFTSVEAGALTIWSLQIFETSAFDVISRDDVAERAQMLVRREQKLQAVNPLEDAMDTSTVPTLLACGAFFVLSFVTIWAFWFAERLRGANAPHV